MRRYEHLITSCGRKADAIDCVNALYDACEYIASLTGACPLCKRQEEWERIGGSEYCCKTCTKEPTPNKHVDCWMGYFYLMQKLKQEE